MIDWIGQWNDVAEYYSAWSMSLFVGVILVWKRTSGVQLCQSSYWRGTVIHLKETVPNRKTLSQFADLNVTVRRRAFLVGDFLTHRSV